MKLSKFKGVFAVALACVLTLSALSVSGITVNAADSETVTATVSGTYYTANYDAILARLNEIRLEAYELGYVTSYVPLQWSSALEEAAIQRAAEADYYLGHTRTDGTSCYTVYSGVSAENLAWNANTDTIMSAIDKWYSEKAEYYDQGNTSYEDAGHYINMINPSYNYTGLAAFKIDGAYWACTAQEFSSLSGLDESHLNYSASSASFEIDKYVLTSVSVTADSTALEVGDTANLTVTATSSLSSSSIPLTDGFTISSSDTSVLTVDTLTATAVGAGSADITVVAGSDFSAVVTITVTESSSETGSTDTGSTDTGSTDTGSTDTGSTDTGSTDTGSTDTGSTDTGSTDTGSTDTGSTDTGSTDTGSTNTGSTDTGSTTDTSTGSSDTGSTGSTDTGSSSTGSSSVASDEDNSNSAFQEYVISIENEIVTAAKSEEPVVTIGEDSGMTALPNSVMQYLVQNSNVSLVFDFVYDGNEYSITIPAGTAIDNDIPWYGPLYLLEKYGTNTAETTETTADTTEDAIVSLYTVQAGDTLSVIAADFDTTLGKLIALNPQIADPNWIYPGDVLNIG